MKGLLRTIVTVIVFIFPFCFQLAFCGSSPNVPIDNHVYRDIDQLVAAGLIKDAIYGQRPWSRHEIARLIKEARRHLPELGSIVSFNPNLGLRIMAEDTIKNLEREYKDELSERRKTRLFRPFQQARLDLAYLDSPFRALPEDNGLTQIKGSINPLVSYQEGRRFADGGTLAIESEHWAQTSEYFSVYARPRFDVLDPRDGSSDAHFRAQSLYGKLNYRNVELQVGRDSLIWGHGEYGGVLASNNARNMDMVKVSNDTPIILPSFFKYLGPSKYTVFVGKLDSEFVLKNAYVYGLAASFKPLPNLEIGIKHQTMVGGEGSPSISFGQIVREFFFQRASAWPQESMDNREGFDVRLNIPKWRNAVVYAEGVFEDFGRKSFWPQFTEQMGFVSGLYFPRITSDGINDLRVELEHSPAAYGRHYLYRSGLTADDRLRGSELGPDGKAARAIGRHIFESGTQMRAEVHYEIRKTDNYMQTPTSDGGVDRVIPMTNYPTEHRFRILISLDHQVWNKWSIRPAIGYEHVWNFNSDALNHKNNLFAVVSLAWVPRF